MPRIPDSYIDCVVYIYDSAEAANEGRSTGGSGFVIRYPSGVGDWGIRYVVTNDHVVANGGQYVRLNYRGGTYVVHVAYDDWVFAPEGDDIAIAVLSVPVDLRGHELALDRPSDSEAGERLLLTREEARRLRVGLGDEAYMLGRFIAHDGKLKNAPIARFGSIALMPDANSLVRDGRGRDVEAYLIEMRSHAGFSGSAVFLVIPWNTFRGEFGFTEFDDQTTRFRLLGIDTGHKVDVLPVLRNGGAVPELTVPHYSDISIVSPIWKVVDLLESDEFISDRILRGRALQERFGSSLPQVDANEGR
jgi:hypothetical protein